MWAVDLEEGEVDFDAEAWGHSDEPGAVSRVGVLLWVIGGEDGPIVRGNVPSTRHFTSGKGVVPVASGAVLTGEDGVTH